MIPNASRNRRAIVPALLAVAALALLTPALHADDHVSQAPPGWELRNGSWVPLIQPGDGTPEALVAKMIKDLAEGHTGDVINEAKEWVKRHKTNPLMPQVLLLQGDAEVARGNKYKSLFSYEEILNNYPSSELYSHVIEREYHVADALLLGYKRKFFGLRILTAMDDAMELLDRIQDRQRGSPIAERAGIRIADFQFENGKFQEAVDAYSDFLKRYPYSQYVRKAEIRRAEASLANFHGVLFDLTPLFDARERLANISQTYPQSAEALQTKAVDDRIYEMEGKKELEIARYYWRAGAKHAAGFYYKRVIANWPDTSSAKDARAELARRLPKEVGK